MKVSELIEQLETMNQGAHVVVSGGNGRVTTIESVTEVRIVDDCLKDVFCWGKHNAHNEEVGIEAVHIE